ncbi:hypothetical protein EMCRGX_G001051 [Ephydatia muelleri]
MFTVIIGFAREGVNIGCGHVVGCNSSSQPSPGLFHRLLPEGRSCSWVLLNLRRDATLDNKNVSQHKQSLPHGTISLPRRVIARVSGKSKPKLNLKGVRRRGDRCHILWSHGEEILLYH